VIYVGDRLPSPADGLLMPSDRYDWLANKYIQWVTSYNAVADNTGLSLFV